MKYQVRTCYAHPERLREGVNENGARVVERIPGHATRPAREFEVNCWWEDAPEGATVADAIEKWLTIRFADGVIYTRKV